MFTRIRGGGKDPGLKKKQKKWGFRLPAPVTKYRDLTRAREMQRNLAREADKNQTRKGRTPLKAWSRRV